jgi:hypothetical protein
LRQQNNTPPIAASAFRRLIPKTLNNSGAVTATLTKQARLIAFQAMRTILTPSIGIDFLQLADMNVPR